jgi:Intracellular proteinase inhibitor
MRPVFLPAIFFLLLPAFVRAENSVPVKSDRGVWPALKRTWSATVEGAESAAKVTSSAVQSASYKVAGVFLPGESKAKKKPALEIQVVCSPSPVSVRQTKVLSVVVKAFNSGKRAQLLEFPSSQRADAVLRDPSGAIVGRASATASVKADTSLVTVNPGERLEYTLSLPTTGMLEGKTYTLECALVGQAGLTARVLISAK